MRFLAGFYIGILFLLVGVVLLLNNFFHFHLNIFKLALGTLIISLGIFFLFNDFGFQDSRNIIFKEGSIRVSKVQDEYNIIFASGTVDLSKIKVGDSKEKVKINAIFSDGKAILNPEVPTLIKASSAFGELELPDKSSVIFSSKKYSMGEINLHQGYLEIEANAVFGKLKFVTTH